MEGGDDWIKAVENVFVLWKNNFVSVKSGHLKAWPS